MLRRALWSPTLLLLLIAVPAQAQNPRPLEIADYHTWQSIQGSTIAPDGEHVAWSYTKLRSDATLHVRRLSDDETTEIARGASARFSDDGLWVAYRIAAPWDDEDGEERVGLLSLESGEQWSWTGPGSFGFSPGSSHFWLKKRTGDEDADGSDLVLRNLSAGYDELIGGVDEYGWNESGSLLAYTVDAADGDGNGLYILDASTGARRALDNASVGYAGLAWAEDGGALAVLRGDVPEGFTERENAVVIVSAPGTRDPQVRVFDALEGLREGWVVSEGADLRWSENEEVLFVGTKAQGEELPEWGDDGLPLADVNIWHWQDERIQTAQARTLSRDQNRTDLAALHLDEGSLVHLDVGEDRVFEVTPDGRWALSRDQSPYVSDWRPSYGDYARVDVRTGERVPVLEQHLRILGMSPDGEYWLYWKDGDVHAYEVAEDRHMNLTAGAPVDFTDAEYDYHGEHPPYGVEGWVGEDGDAEAVVLAHRFDLWLQPLDGGTAEPLTGSTGSERAMELRIVDTTPDEEWIDLDDDLLLSAFETRTKRQGWYTLQGDAVAQITLEDARFGGLRKAADAEVFLYTRETFRDFPDLHVSGPNLRERDRITEANPQQAEFLWGDRILFDYELADGTPLQGILAVPETRAEGERLPMIVRFYEKMSDQLHQYPAPTHRHSPNFAGYVSNGYMIMQPDVHFRVGSSHTDMLEAIEAATQKVIDMGYADPEAVGLSGHSYSGGGGAFIATKSDMFAAVAHGAAPINLVSEFNQLFVGSGQNNHSYDIYGQGRYATDPYADFDLYWEQSPISGVEDMDTPVLYLHGEADPTVNWEQGLEWYNALRFLGKPIIWLSYPDEGHGLSKLENRIDFQYRLRQFFGHHLRGEPAPGWMTDGVSQLEKERHLREFAPRIFAPPRLIG